VSYTLAADEALRLKADADRYAYVKTMLAQGMSLHMDGTMQFRLRSPQGRGRDLDEVIDKLLEEFR
jgi:hypothetical protein